MRSMQVIDMNTEVNFKRNQLILLGCFAVIIAVLVFVSRESLIRMEQLWRGKEEYGYAQAENCANIDYSVMIKGAWKFIITEGIRERKDGDSCDTDK